MTTALEISEVEETLSSLQALGFHFVYGRILIFDREFQYSQDLEIQNTKLISVNTIKSPIMFDSDLTKFVEYIKSLPINSLNWKFGFPDLLPNRILKASNQRVLQIALELANNHRCFIAFEYNTKLSKLEENEMNSFSTLLRIGLNSYLKSNLLRKKGTLVDKLRLENNCKDFILSFEKTIASAKSIEELEQLVETELKTIPLQRNLFIKLSGLPIRHTPDRQFSSKTTGSINYKTISPGKELLPEEFNPFSQINSNPDQCYIVEEIKLNKIQDLATQLNRELRVRKIEYIGFAIVASNCYGTLWLINRQNPVINPEELKFYIAVVLHIANSIEKIQTRNTLSVQLAEFENYKLRLEIENTYLQADIKNESWIEELDYYGEKMQQVSQLIRKVAVSNSTVLIQGDTGTGKELVARAIHAASNRKSNILVKLNCAALPPTLIESELFGHERGSFTGATERHIGKFELAANGTLLLDEIGEMPLEVQAKVLRAIQEKEIERIGGNGTIKVNVRIIAATNRDLQREVLEGRFRSDLFYRLNVFPISVPRLKDRKEDIIKLSDQFIKKFSGKANAQTYSFSDKCMDQMMKYDWPGNVRELEHLIERSILLTKGTIIRNIDLNFPVRRLNGLRKDNRMKTLDENEREYILRALSLTNGKVYGKDGAAELLGIHYSTLNSRMKKLGIQKAVITST